MIQKEAWFDIVADDAAQAMKQLQHDPTLDKLIAAIQAFDRRSTEESQFDRIPEQLYFLGARAMLTEARKSWSAEVGTWSVHQKGRSEGDLPSLSFLYPSSFTSPPPHQTLVYVVLYPDLAKTLEHGDFYVFPDAADTRFITEFERDPHVLKYGSQPLRHILEDIEFWMTQYAGEVKWE